MDELYITPNSPLSPKNESNITNLISIVENKNEEDKEIEVFWYGFKQSILNFSKNNDKIYKNLYYQLEFISNKLNNLKKNKQFLNIIEIISNFINDCIIIIFNELIDSYHSNIFITNIKRWEIIIEQNSTEKFLNKELVLYARIYNKIVSKNNIISNDDHIRFFKSIDINNYNENEKIIELTFLVLKYNVSYYLDIILKNYLYIIPYLNQKYKLNIHKSTKGTKIIKLLKNHI
uniref:Uncharacterized protein n=1 Tax=viral metagenome TaxID=1070528 RepID=A0A6C0JC87_9ZZZZ